MRKKIIKYVSVLVAVIIAFSLFTINASAETVQTLYTDFWTLNKDESKLWIVDTDDGGKMTDVTSKVSFSVLSNGKIMGVMFHTNEDWGKDNIYYVNFVLDLNTQYVKPGYSDLAFALYEWTGHAQYTDIAPNENTGEVYAPWGYRDGNYYINGNNERDYQELHTEPVVHNASTGVKKVVYDFKTHYAKNGFKRVCVFAYITLTDSMANGGYKVYFEFAGLKYRYSTEGEYLNNQVIENQNYNTDRIISNADKNAAEIQQNQDENTDKILNGDSDLDSSSETDKVDGAVGDIDEATDEALGGKSEAEIEAEVSGALDPKQLGNIDVTKAKRMSTFYDRCLKSFGIDYNSLLLLSLILGLAAFLIGRRYG